MIAFTSITVLITCLSGCTLSDCGDLPAKGKEGPGELSASSRVLYDEIEKKSAAGEHEAALVLAEKLAAKELKLDWVQHTAASAAFVAGKYELAIRYCDQAVTINPKHDGAWNIRANSNARLERFADAERDFTKELEIDPKASSALHSRSFCRREQGKFKDALADITEVLKTRNDESPMALYVIILLDNLMFDEAQRAADKLFAAHPSPDARLVRALVLLVRSKDKEADAEIEKILDAEPRLKETVEVNRAQARFLKAKAMAPQNVPSTLIRP